MTLYHPKLLRVASAPLLAGATLALMLLVTGCHKADDADAAGAAAASAAVRPAAGSSVVVPTSTAELQQKMMSHARLTIADQAALHSMSPSARQKLFAAMRPSHP